jgi:hypothetical protein
MLFNSTNAKLMINSYDKLFTIDQFSSTTLHRNLESPMPSPFQRSILFTADLLLLVGTIVVIMSGVTEEITI